MTYSISQRQRRDDLHVECPVRCHDHQRPGQHFDYRHLGFDQRLCFGYPGQRQCLHRRSR